MRSQGLGSTIIIRKYYDHIKSLFSSSPIGVAIGALVTISLQHLTKPENTITQSQRTPELKIALEPNQANSNCGEVFVWKSTIMPEQKGLNMHRHNYARMLIPLTTGVLTRVEGNGAQTHYDLQPGKPVFLSDDTPEGFHTDENLGSAPIEVVVVQFNKQPPVIASPLSVEELNQALVTR